VASGCHSSRYPALILKRRTRPIRAPGDLVGGFDGLKKLRNGMKNPRRSECDRRGRGGFGMFGWSIVRGRLPNIG